MYIAKAFDKIFTWENDFQTKVNGNIKQLLKVNEKYRISSSVKLFSDDTTIFSIVFDKDALANKFNCDLNKVAKLAHNWKISFYPDSFKHANVSGKINKHLYTFSRFNKSLLQITFSQEHLGLFLDNELTFPIQLKEKLKKLVKYIGILQKLQHHSPQKSILTIYTSFIWPHLDYRDIIYD